MLVDPRWRRRCCQRVSNRVICHSCFHPHITIIGELLLLLLLLLVLLLLLLTAIDFCHSVAVVLTVVQTEQIRINIHKRNNTKTVQTIQNTVNTSTHITKTHTHYKTHTYTQPHISKPTHTHTHTLQNPYVHTHTHPHITS
jgi:hypothetical protein